MPMRTRLDRCIPRYYGLDGRNTTRRRRPSARPSDRLRGGPRPPSIVRASDGYRRQSDRCRFITIALQEPAKDGVLEWEAGRSPARPREAEVVLLDRGRAETIEAVVSLDDGAVIGWNVRTDVQPMAVVAELMEAEELLRLHPEFQAALARRGVTDPEQIQVDAWPAGHFGRDEESERRLARGVAFVKPKPGDNEWAHPVDGVIALVDLNTLEVLRVEDHGVVPVPQESGNFDAAAGAPLRADIAPLEITQPDGPGFTVDGRVVRWQRWQLHVGFTPREGLVLNRVGYEDGGRVRPIMHRASLSEMVVPYGDPSPTHYFKNAFDAGENGVGVAASPLTRGCDCLGEIVYLDAVCNDAAGEPVVIPNAICMHEEDVRRPLAPHRVARRHGRGAALAAARDLVVLGDRELRLRLLLVPLPGRLDRVRGQADRRPLDRRGGTRRPARARRPRRPGPERDGAPALLQHAPRHGRRRARERRRGGVDGVAAARPGQPRRERVPAVAPPARDRARGPPAARPGLGALVGDREPRRPPPARRARRPTGSSRARTRRRSPSPTRR